MTATQVKFVSLRLNESTKASLDKASEKEGRSRSDIARIALQQWLRKKKYLALVGGFALGFGVFHAPPAHAWTDDEDVGLTAPVALPAGARVTQQNCHIVMGGRAGTVPCTILSQRGAPNTVVLMGSGKMLIQRLPEKGTATFWDILGDGSKAFLGSAIARGACWEGHAFRFCAE